MTGRVLTAFALIAGAMALTGADPVMATLAVAVALTVLTVTSGWNRRAAISRPSAACSGLRHQPTGVQGLNTGDLDCPVGLSVIRR